MVLARIRVRRLVLRTFFDSAGGAAASTGTDGASTLISASTSLGSPVRSSKSSLFIPCSFLLPALAGGAARPTGDRGRLGGRTRNLALQAGDATNQITGRFLRVVELARNRPLALAVEMRLAQLGL